MLEKYNVIAPGARIVVRDAEWIVRTVDRTSTTGQAVTAVGISELVRDKEAVFLTEIDKNIQVLDPAETRLVPDKSGSFQASILHIESLLRQTPPTDENLYIGNKAAMDVVPYQLDAAIQALEQPRQRILIADAVGLGKTLEAGVLLSELIRRGRGKRILVVAVKSMLTQFQKEMWSRFTIPLTRLDSVGIQRIRSRIPTNHNPFYYYDKAIISIDTLKQDTEYRTYLENAYWDVIVIDEAHNVAERGKGASLRARLAKLLAGRSDTLIMLSATPHDGSAGSFASLMNMLDPTAISDPEKYGPDDIKGLFIRRFKKDIQDQVESAFKERIIRKVNFDASDVEEVIFDSLVDMTFSRLDKRRAGSELFKTTLEKALFSSPAACLSTLSNRINRLKNTEDPAFDEDIRKLESLSGQVGKVKPHNFSKYQKLLELLGDGKGSTGWTGKDKEDRLVIFTERIETMKFLYKHLMEDLKLNEKMVETLHGGMSDIDQQRIVEDFGKDEAHIRLLIASDVASEGINLHYLSHRMIHFDIPWSLMVFSQRNGRIDRYGQEQTPEIYYLVTESRNGRIRGDMRILELLINKDQEATKNIGDPSAFMGVYDQEEEEKITSMAIECGQTPQQFDEDLQNRHRDTFDPLALLMGDLIQPTGQQVEDKTGKMPSLFDSDYNYMEKAITYLRDKLQLQTDFDADKREITLTAPEELKHRFKYYPDEIMPTDGRFILSADTDKIQEEIRRSRKEERAWLNIHYLWELNPVVQWINDKLLTSFGRHEAPVITLHGSSSLNEITFIMSGLIPNRKGHPLMQVWFGVCFRQGVFTGVKPIEEVFYETGLGSKPLPNRGEDVDTHVLQGLLPEAVKQARLWMDVKRTNFQDRIDTKLYQYLEKLEKLRKSRHEQLEFDFAGSRLSESLVEERKGKQKRDINRLFDEYISWAEDTMLTNEHPYIQVVAVLRGVQ